MSLIDEKEIIKQAEEKSRCFESFGEIAYDQHDVRLFYCGAIFAEQQLKPLFVLFKDWCEEYELKQVLDDIFVLGEAEYKQKTTEELFELWLEEQTKK